MNYALRACEQLREKKVTTISTSLCDPAQKNVDISTRSPQSVEGIQKERNRQREMTHDRDALDQVDTLVYQSLMAIYEATRGNSWTHSYHWNDISVSPCRWYGVCCNVSMPHGILYSPPPNWKQGSFEGSTCSPSGNITMLDLSSNNLVGTLPPEIGQLSTVQSLLLYSNQLSGSIPATIGNLIDVRKLSIDSNTLTGSIPSSIGQLVNLRILIMLSNALSGSLPPTLGQLQELLLLELEDNNLIGTIPESIYSLRTMKSLLLSDNRLSGSISSDMGHLKAIEILSIANNQLTGTLPKALGRMQNVSELRLQGNQFTGTIPDELSLLNNSLTLLELGRNKLSGTLPTNFANFVKLGTISLNDNLLIGTIPPEYAMISALEVFDVSQNQLEGSIPLDMFFLQELGVLAAYQNKIKMSLPSQDKNDYSKCTQNGYQLSRVDLSDNNIEGALSFFMYHGRLLTLELRNNSLSGLLELDFLTGIGNSAVCSFSHGGVLEGLDVSNNLFQTVGKLPASLRSFRAPRNQLQGNLNHISALTSAYFIDIEENKGLSSDLPTSILTGGALKYLFIGDTGLKSALGSQLPEGLNFKDNYLSSFVEGNSTIECPMVVFSESPNAFISLNPIYYSYSSCSCGFGQEGQGPVCYKCPPGKYNNNDRATVCRQCPPQTFAPSEGSSDCIPCQLPLAVAYANGAFCLSLIPYYVGALLIAVVIAVPIIISGAILAAICTSFGAIFLYRKHAAYAQRKQTALIEKRARDEIPADLLIRYQDLKFETIVGFGSFSRVHRGFWKHSLVAIKELTGVQALMATLSAERNGSISERDVLQEEKSHRLVEAFRSEVLTMADLHHPNVLLLVGACSEFPQLCIITEYLPNGSLFDTLHRGRAKDHISWSQQIQWLRETAAGMNYLHEQGLLHRDLKSPNVLLTSSWCAKICDFGLAKMLSGTSQRQMTTEVGSILWMAPEIVESATYTYSADVYSWGILAWEIMSPSEDLYEGVKTYDIARLVLGGFRPSLKPTWPAGIHALIALCWNGSADIRPSFAEISAQLQVFAAPEISHTYSISSFKDGDLLSRLLQE